MLWYTSYLSNARLNRFFLRGLGSGRFAKKMLESRPEVKLVKTVDIVEIVETVETVETVEIMETMETVETVKTDETEDWKSVTHSVSK